MKSTCLIAALALVACKDIPKVVTSFCDNSVDFQADNTGNAPANVARERTLWCPVLGIFIF